MKRNKKRAGESDAGCLSILALALAVGGCMDATAKLKERNQDLQEALERETEARKELDVFRRAELDRQMQWRKNFIPHEARDLFERET